MKTKFKFLATMLIGILLSTNVWGASPVTIAGEDITGFGSGTNYTSGSFKASDGITIESSSGFSTTQFRVAKSNSLTISIASGKITQVKITVSTTGYKLNSNLLSYNNTVGTYTNSTGTSSVTFNNSNANIARITEIEITYSGSTPTPATHYTVSFYNNGVKVGEATTETYEDNGKEYLNEEDLPDMSSASFPHPTSKTFAGWITDEITTPATSIDYHHFIDQNTAITENCSVNALWGTTTGGSTATFNANDVTNLSETSGSGFHQWADKSTGIAMGGDDAQYYTSGSPKTFIIKSASDVWNTVYFDGNDKVIAQYVVTASSISYGISDPAHGAISSSGAVYTVTNVNANYTYAYTNNEETENQQIRVTNAVVTCYTGYITHYTACTPAGTALAVSASPTSITTSETSTLSVTGGNGGTVTYSVTSSNASNAHIDGTTFSATTVGTYTVTAHQDMNGDVCEQNATVDIEVTPERHEVRWHVGGVVTTDEVAEDAAITFPADPSAPAACEEKSFYGWAKSEIVGETEDAPTVYTSETMGTVDIDFYAVFADKEGSGENGWVKITDAEDIIAGVYAVISYDEAYYLPTTASSSSNPTATAVTKTDGKINILDAMKWNLTISEGVINLESATTAGVYAWGGSANDGVRVNSTSTKANATKDWRVKTTTNYGLVLYNNATTDDRYLSTNGTTDWRNYTSTNTTNRAANLYKLENNTTYSAFVTSCAAYTVTFKSNGADVTTVSNVAPGQQVTAPTLAEIKTQAGATNACTNYLIGWSTESHYTNPSAAPSGMLKPNAEGKITIPSDITGDVTYYAVYADVAGE